MLYYYDMSHLEYTIYKSYGERAKEDLWYSQAVRVGDVIELAGQGNGYFGVVPCN